MEILQVNQGVTDRNREQTKWIVQKLGYTHMETEISDKELGGKLESALGKRIGLAYDEHDQPIALPNGSFTLDQVVGMLEAEGWFWMATNEKEREKELDEGAWWSDMGGYTVMQARAHDITAAMDALIQLLEEKNATL